MKKVFALILAVVLVMSLSVTAFAAKNSPSPEVFHTVQVINGQGANTEIHKVKVGEDVELIAKDDIGPFNEWKIFLNDGTPAVPGTHYTIVGKLTDKTIVLKPLTNLIVTGNYNGKDTTFKVQNGEATSPKTGDTAVVAIASVMVLSLAGAVVAKKQMAK